MRALGLLCRSGLEPASTMQARALQGSIASNILSVTLHILTKISRFSQREL